VAYTRAAKIDTLGMPSSLYTTQGSVHREAVKAMAEGVRRLSNAQVGVAESGVAGPGAGGSGLPIGTVWAAVVTPERELQRELHLPGNRLEVMEGIVERVLAMLEEILTPSQSA
jgi:nicotinamide-nucleotide amidase